MATESLSDRLKHQIVAVTIAYPHNTDLRDLLIETRNALGTSESASPQAAQDLVDGLRYELKSKVSIVNAVRDWNRLSNGRARYRELDQIVNAEEWVDV